MSRVAFNLRDRMSADHWRTLNQLTSDPVFQRRASMPLTLAWLDRAVLDQLHAAAHVVSEELSLKFFSHAASRSVLSLVA